MDECIIGSTTEVRFDDLKSTIFPIKSNCKSCKVDHRSAYCKESQWHQYKVMTANG